LENFENVKIEQKFLTHFEIAEIQKTHGTFLNPTRWDSQGVSRDEAMASGLVVITNNVAAIPEFIDESSGILVEGEDYLAMANAVKLLYKQPNKFLELSKGASSRIRNTLGLKKTIIKEIDLIMETP